MRSDNSLNKGEFFLETRQEEAIYAIENMIQKSQLKAGDKLPSQRQLVDSLGMSRTTIREALIALEQQGKIEISAKRGAFISEHAPATLPSTASASTAQLAGRETQMYQFRSAIEPAVARLAAENATQAQINDLTRLAQHMRNAAKDGDTENFFRLDFAFHSQMTEAANNMFFAQSMAPLLNLFFESQILPQSDKDNIWQIVEEHDAVLKAIQNRTPIMAKDTMRTHIASVAQRAGVWLTPDRED